MERAAALAWLGLLAGLCLLGCGGMGGDTSSGSRPSSSADRSSPAPADKSSYGDYDNDDYERADKYNDADNDDSNLPKDRDNDSDNSSGSYFDSDDNSVREFGHAANAADAHAITALVKRYYAAGAAEQGARACSMLALPIARSVPEVLGRPPGPPYLRGSTCAAVMTKVFEKNHRQVSAYAARLEVNGVRLADGLGLVILDFKTLPGREVEISRENGAWRIEALLDRELP
jgi:hypothetical protein